MQEGSDEPDRASAGGDVARGSYPTQRLKLLGMLQPCQDVLLTCRPCSTGYDNRPHLPGPAQLCLRLRVVRMCVSSGELLRYVWICARYVRAAAMRCGCGHDRMHGLCTLSVSACASCEHGLAGHLAGSAAHRVKRPSSFSGVVLLRCPAHAATASATVERSCMRLQICSLGHSMSPMLPFLGIKFLGW